ncbi:MAG: hypothetical protein ACI9UV_003208, partial [Algoriphagus sp.]
MKNFFKIIGAWIKGKLNLIKPGAFAIKGAAIGLLVLTLIMFVIEVVGMSINRKDLWILAFGLLILWAVTLVSFLSVKLIKLIFEIPRGYKLALIACAILLSLVRLNDERFAVFMILVYSLFGAGVAMFWKGHFRRLTTPKKVVSILGFVVGTVGISCLVYFGSIRGLEIDEQINASKLTEDKVSQIQAPSPAADGSLEFTIFTYGSGKDLRREEFAEG